MLSELRVRDLAVIADVTLTLDSGLSVLTGETGAGKSMLVDALALLLGERASGDLVRPGADRASIEAAFDVTEPSARESVRLAAAELGIDLDEDRLIVKREIRTQGSNRAWANGSPTTLAALATVGRLLVDLHGQHEAQSLLRPAAQREMLDAFGDATAIRQRVAACHAAGEALRREEADLIARREAVEARADYLRHVAREITEAGLKAGEDEALATEARRLAAGEDLTRLCDELMVLMEADGTGVLEQLGAADRALGQLERIDPTVARWHEVLDTAFAAVDELARAVRAYGSDIEIDEGRLGEVEQRRDQLYRLKQKYGKTMEEVLATGADASRELDLLDTAELDLASIRARRTTAEAALAAAAAELSAARRRASDRLGAAVTQLLPGLGLANGHFTVALEPLATVTASGADGISFTVQLNEGLDARPLAQVASGGELSRIMLALKVVLAQHDAIPTLVFDEVDQGIGGGVGGQVARALAAVAGSRQVLVITHLPQIAARATHHLKVRKHTVRGMTSAAVDLLAGETREREIARMLGDEGDKTLREHAGDLLRRSHEPQQV